MIQEKDFLYRVPVKTAPITTPGGQIRNPEILVDLEGGEFMHGNILDANSTNKLINQSVKDAVDNKLIESGYVTKDLLDAETTRATEQENSLKTLIGAETGARTKGDEDLSSKIQAEQTRAEGKEKDISDKLAIVDGDSNTEGSFRKAIADVIAAAPEDLDALKEIADKLAGNDDLHTALNQAITEKADASALANEVSRATSAESGLQAAIATKADATALSNYVLTTALNQQIDTLNTAISAKQDKPDDGNMFFQVEHDSVSGWFKQKGELKFTHDDNDSYYASISPSGIYCMGGGSPVKFLRISSKGIELSGGQGTSGYAFTTNGKTAHIPTLTSQLTNDSNFIAANHISDRYLSFEKDLKIYSEDSNNITTISHTGINFETDINDVAINQDGFFVSRDSDDAHLCSFTPTGIRFADKTDKDIPTADGTFINVNDLASADDVSSLRAGLSRKQDKITVNEVDTTDIETADITKLRTIVTNLINALSASDLIRETKTLE